MFVVLTTVSNINHSNLLGDDSAGTLLEAISDNPSLTKLDISRNLVSLARKLSTLDHENGQ